MTWKELTDQQKLVLRTRLGASTTDMLLLRPEYSLLLAISNLLFKNNGAAYQSRNQSLIKQLFPEIWTPAQSQFKWPDIHHDYLYIARDMNGQWLAYEKEPVQDLINNQWQPKPNTRYLSLALEVEPPFTNWTNSLLYKHHVEPAPEEEFTPPEEVLPPLYVRARLLYKLGHDWFYQGETKYKLRMVEESPTKVVKTFIKDFEYYVWIEATVLPGNLQQMQKNAAEKITKFLAENEI